LMVPRTASWLGSCFQGFLLPWESKKGMGKYRTSYLYSSLPACNTQSTNFHPGLRCGRPWNWGAALPDN
jgi:hypothetical protein